MGYPNFGKVKTIVLSCCNQDDEISIEEYKNRYGIDLKEFLSVNANKKTLEFKAKNSMVLVESTTVNLAGMDSTNILIPVTRSFMSAHDVDAGVDAVLILGGYNESESSIYGINFRVPHRKDLNLDNVVISYKGF